MSECTNGHKLVMFNNNEPIDGGGEVGCPVCYYRRIYVSAEADVSKLEAEVRELKVDFKLLEDDLEEAKDNVDHYEGELSGLEEELYEEKQKFGRVSKGVKLVSVADQMRFDNMLEKFVSEGVQ